MVFDLKVDGHLHFLAEERDLDVFLILRGPNGTCYVARTANLTFLDPNDNVTGSQTLRRYPKLPRYVHNKCRAFLAHRRGVRRSPAPDFRPPRRRAKNALHYALQK